MRGPRKKLHHVAFGAPGAEFEATGGVDPAGWRSAGIDARRAERPRAGCGCAIRTAMSSTCGPEAGETPPADPPLTLNSPGHVARVAARGCPGARGASAAAGPHPAVHRGARPAGRFLHAGARGSSSPIARDGIIAFLRCSTDHHNLALLKSDGPGFHHGSFEVGSIDEIALGAQRMLESGRPPGWGLGRHVIGSNFFYYTRDPWGSWAEYFHDLDHIPEACAWQPRDFPEADALYRWGPPVPEDFGRNRELES